MAARITGRNINLFIGGYPVMFKNASLGIEDGSEVAMTAGMPDGHVEGDKKASGEIEMDYKYFKVIAGLAKASGSYSEIEPLDLDFPAATTGEAFHAKAFGCKFTLSDIINADKNGKTVGTIKLPYFVSSSDFVDIDGVPYASNAESLGIWG